LNKSRGIFFVVSFSPQNADGKDEDSDSIGGSLRNKQKGLFGQVQENPGELENYELTDDERDNRSLDQSKTSSDSAHHSFSTGSMDSLAGSSILHFAMQLYAQDSSKARCLHLGPLSREAVWQLVTATYSKYYKSKWNFELEDNEVEVKKFEDIVTKLHFASGGHPLHVTEIANSVIQRGFCKSSIDFFLKLEKVLSEIKSNNIDDLIFYNFDMLSPQCQLLLKAASVISATGSSFTAKLIASMLLQSTAKDLEDSRTSSKPSSIASVSKSTSRDNLYNMVEPGGVKELPIPSTDEKVGVADSPENDDVSKEGDEAAKGQLYYIALIATKSIFILADY